MLYKIFANGLVTPLIWTGNMYVPISLNFISAPSAHSSYEAFDWANPLNTVAFNPWPVHASHTHMQQDVEVASF